MDIGIGLPNALPDATGDLFTQWAERAEALGFSSLATIGRVAYPTHEEITVLAAAAAVTSRIRLHTNVLLAPTRNFVLLAKEAATLDRLAAGRFTLGLAVGGRADDYEATGQDMSTRGRRFDEGLDLMHRAWRGELVAGAGSRVCPRPINDDRVPLLFGGGPSVAADRVVRWGTGWTTAGPPEMLGGAAASIRAAWTAAGKPGVPRIVALTYFGLGEGTEETSRRNLLDYYAFLGDFAGVIAGSAARTIEDARGLIQAYEAVGADEVVFSPSVARLDEIDRLADAVM
jgi:alkanesulfonate monooxygenase SsuD/methylene tetrahydromethanopterin reductase-like flavin-dependent oxidoreductase (luciferase family)